MTDSSFPRANLEDHYRRFTDLLRDIEKLAAPHRSALAAIEDVACGLRAALDALAAEHGAVIAGPCECGAPILIGDRYHQCSDGPALCESCAPTWADIQRQAEEEEALGGDPVDEYALRSRDAIAAHLAGGGALTDKVLYTCTGPLE